MRKLNRTETLFHRWNALRLGSTEEESIAAMENTNNSFLNGIKGNEFHVLLKQVGTALNGIHFGPRGAIALNEAADGLIFLRQLAYRDSFFWDRKNNPLFRRLARRKKDITIVDFGCGLAQVSREMCLTLKRLRATPRLYLYDVKGLRKDFLVWAVEQEGINAKFMTCTENLPIPPFPPCDMAVLWDVLEHLYNPIEVLSAVDKAILPGGYIVGNMKDQRSHPFHCSPNLASVREYLQDHGYRMGHRWLYEKTGGLAMGKADENKASDSNPQSKPIDPPELRSLS